jgi:hypothetical protein
MDRRLLDILDPFEIPPHILGREGITVMEGDALVKTEDMHTVADDLPFFGEVRDEANFLAVIGDLENAVIDVIVNRCGGDVGGVVGVEGIDIDPEANLDRPAAFGLLAEGRWNTTERHGLRRGQDGGPAKRLEECPPGLVHTQQAVDDFESIAARSHAHTLPRQDHHSLHLSSSLDGGGHRWGQRASQHITPTLALPARGGGDSFVSIPHTNDTPQRAPIPQ